MKNGQVRAQSSDRIGSLDGMRGVAILSVILLHWVIRPSEEAIQTASPQIYQLLNQAAHGVDIFFVISGFLIGRILLTRAECHGFLRTFYVRRFFRIIPLYYAVVFLLLAGRFSLGDYSENFVPAGTYFIFVNNFFTAEGRLDFPEFGPLWSLAIEEQFYLVSALAAAAFGRKGVILLALLLVSGSVGTRLLVLFSFIDYNWWPSTLGHSDPIGIGLIVAALITSPRASVFLQGHPSVIRSIAVGAVVVFLLASLSHNARLFGLDVFSISTAVGCWVALKFSGQPKSVLTFAPLRQIGKMSFSLYILHQGWQVYTNWIADIVGVSGAAKLGISFALLVLVCRFLWTYVEAPLIARGHNSRYGTIR